MNKKQFILDSKSLKIREILNKDFLEIEILAISEGENRNDSAFTLESMKKSIPTFYNKFILGYFNVQGNDGNFEEHNADVKYDTECDEFYYSYLAPNAEKALGLIRESDKVEIVEVKGKKWIRLTAAILTKYNREAVKHLLKSKNKKKVSVEITIEKSHEQNGITIIDEFTLDGITILGTRKNSTRPCTEAIEGASMVLRFLQSEVYNTQKKALTFAYKELETEGLNSNEEQEEITMKDNTNNTNIDEGGKMPMLTYEQKRELLEAKLNELLCSTKKEEDECECVDCYCWVCDLDENEVYYHFNCSYWKALYVINEDENTVEINTEEAKQVTRSWKEFALEEETEVFEKDVNGEVFEDDSNKINSDENKDEDDDNEEKEESKDTEISEEEDEESKEIEDKEEDEEGKCTESCNESCDKACAYTLNIKQFKNDSSEDVTIEAVINTTAEAYSQIVNACDETANTLENLRASYADLKAKYDSIMLEKKNKELFAYGQNLIEAEDALEPGNSASLVAELESKCKKGEFSSEEEVKTYAEERIAKVVYQQVKNYKGLLLMQTQKEKTNNTTNFSTKIKSSTLTLEDTVEVEDSMEKMKNILNIKN